MGKVLGRAPRAACALLWGLVLAAPARGYEVGGIAAAPQVSPSGSFVYTIPIEVPPGTAGMAPELALRYDSAGADGPLGLGFSLDGLSAVSRCPQTVAQDGAFRPVRFDGEDRFCLDGARLVAVGGSGSVVEYRTEIERFARIRSEHAGGEVLRFVVEARNGTRSYYAQRVGAVGATRQWLLSRVEDTLGNAIVYRYLELPGSEVLLERIDYTENPAAGLSAYAAVHFEYVERSASALAGWYRGQPVRRTRLLRSIWTTVDGIEARRWTLDYAQLGGAREVIYRIREQAGGRELAPTRLYWAGRDDAPAIARGWLYGEHRDYRFWPGDHDADGAHSLYALRVRDRRTPIAFRVDGGAGDGGAMRATAPRTFPDLPAADWRSAVLDIDGDGRSDAVLARSQPRQEIGRQRIDGCRDRVQYREFLELRALLSGGSETFSAPYRTTRVERAWETEQFRCGGRPPVYQPQSVLILEFDDGQGEMRTVAEIVEGTTLQVDGADALDEAVADRGGMQTTASGSGSVWGNGQSASYPLTDPFELYPADIDGDGRQDLLLVHRSKDKGLRVQALRSEGGGLFRPAPVRNLEAPPWPFEVRYADATADGVPDLLAVHVGDSGLEARLHPGTVGGLFESVWRYSHRRGSGEDVSGAPAVEDPPQPPVAEAELVFADFTRDGNADLAFVSHRRVSPNADLTIHVYESTGAGFAVSPTVTTLRVPQAPARAAPRAGDFNADGLLDLAFARTDSGPLQISFLYGDGAGGFVLGRHEDTGRYQYENLGFQVLDLNADGEQELIVLHPDGLAAASGGGARNGPVSYQPKRGGYQPAPAAEATGGSQVPAYEPPADEPAPPEGVPIGWRVTAIRSGLGQWVVVDYRRLSDPAVYTPGEDCGGYPVRVLCGPMVVARAMQTFREGDGGRRTVRHHYQGLRAELGGRGLLGFGRIEAEDLAAGTRTVTEYLQGFPFTGLPWRSETWAGGALLARTETEYHDFTLRADTVPNVVWTPPARTVESRHEIGSAPGLVSVSETVHEYDPADRANGNLSRATTIVRSADGRQRHETRTENRWADVVDPVRWHLGRLVRTEVTKQWLGVDDPVRVPVTRTTAFAYDPQTGLRTSEILFPDDPALRLEKRLAHDAFGNTVSETLVAADGATRSSRTEYDIRGRFAVRAINAAGHVTEQQYDPLTGAVTQRTDPNGMVTDFDTDPWGRPLGESSRSGGLWVWKRIARGWCTDAPSYCAGAPGAVFWQRVTDSAGGEAVEARDADDQVLRSASRDAMGRWRETFKRYDAAGRLVAESLPQFAGAQPDWVTHTLDAAGRTVEIRQPDGRSVRRRYLGLVQEQIDPLGRVRAEHDDVLGNVRKVVDPAGGTLTTEYDAYGNPVKVTTPGGAVTTIEYDAAGRKTAMHDADSGSWRYAYNGFGEVVEQTSPLGQVVTMAYDALGRMVKRTSPEGQTVWTWDTRWLGALSAVAGPGYRTEYHYTAFGAVARQQQWIERPNAPQALPEVLAYNGLGSGAFALRELAFQYDGQGRLVRTDYPSGDRVALEYGATGAVVALRDAGSGLALWQGLDWDRWGRLSRYRQGNGVETVVGRNRLRGDVETIAAGAGRVLDLVYDWDAVGNLLERHDRRAGYRERFGYDALDRLTESYWYGVPGVADGTVGLSMAYDADGNIRQRSGVGSYTYDPSRPHAVVRAGGHSYRYDAAGQMVEGAGRRYDWTSQGQPHRIRRGSAYGVFLYGADGERRYHVAGDGSRAGTVTYFFGAGYDEQHGPDGSRQRIQLAVGELAVGTIEHAAGQRRVWYTHTDVQGSVVARSDESGTVRERSGYAPFGARRGDLPGSDPLAQTLQPYGYTGHYELAELGLIHMNGRVYDPQLARFVSADPHVQFAQDAQSWNRYSYVHNNPLRYTDPSGYFLKGLFRWVEENWRQLVATALVAVGSMFGPIGAFIGGYLGGLIVSGGDHSVALVSGVAAWLGSSIATGSLGQASWSAAPAKAFARTVLHGAIGGAASKALGGNFSRGFWSTAFGSVAGPWAQSAKASHGNFWGGLATAIVGGTASEIGGGKFANGAITFAFLAAAGEFAEYAERETDRSKYLACSSGGNPCEYDPRGKLRTDGARDVDWSRNPGRRTNWWTRAGMASEGEPHVYDNIDSLRDFIVDVSKPHDFFNSWNYNPSNGFFMSRGVIFDSAFQIYSFAGMPVAALATAVGYAGALPLAEQTLYYHIFGKSRKEGWP